MARWLFVLLFGVVLYGPAPVGSADWPGTVPLADQEILDASGLDPSESSDVRSQAKSQAAPSACSLAEPGAASRAAEALAARAVRLAPSLAPASLRGPPRA